MGKTTIMQLRQLKHLAARTYKTSKSSVTVSTTITKEKVILTRANVRDLVKNQLITFKKIKGTTRHKPKKLKFAKKTLRIKTVRRLRKLLKGVKKEISSKRYRDCYNQIKNGQIKTKAKLKSYVTDN